MSHARHLAREGRLPAAGVARAMSWAMWLAPLLLGACGNAASESGDMGGGGGAASNDGSGSTAYPSGGSAYGSSSRTAGAVSSSSMSDGNSSPAYGGARGGAASSSPAVSLGGASASSASSASSKGVSSSASGGATLSSSGSRAGGAGAGPGSSGRAGATAAGGATGMKGGSGASGGATGMGGQGGGTGSGAAGGTASPPRWDGGVARDAGVSADAGAGAGDCRFSGGAVTSIAYPSGLTLSRACSPYLVSSISVYDNGVLIIEPGVTVKFSNGGILSVGVLGPGRLLAVGNASEVITLTSQEAEPTPGFWRGLAFGGGTVNGSKLAHARITAAGHNRDAALLGDVDLPASVLTIDRVTIDKVGDGANGVLALGERSNIAIANSTFVDVPEGRYPISVYAASFASIGTGNTYPSGGAIEIMGGTIDASVTWSNPGLPVAISGDLVIEGNGNPVLTVGSGMNLRFASNAAVQVGKSAPGKIAIAGTSLARVTLTSLSSTPVSGSWAGLQLWSFGKATISYADFRYGGTNNGDSRGNVTVENSTATVQLAVDHSSFSDSLGWGIYVPCAVAGQNAAIITVDTNTTYANNVLGSKGPGLTCAH